MKNKSVLFLCQYFYPEKISSGVLPYELASELVKQGYMVEALVGYPKEYIEDDKKVKKRENKDGININRIKYLQASRKSILGRIINIISFSFSVLLHPLTFKKADYLICYTNPPLLPVISAFYSRIFHSKLILVIYDLYPDSAIKIGVMDEKNMIARAFNNLYKYTFKKCCKIVVLSTEMKDYLINNKQLDENKIEVIPNWYKSAIDKNNDDNKNDSINVLYGGNMGRAQDMDTLIKAVLLLKDERNIKFTFVGHGVKKDEVQSIVIENDLKNCKIHEFLPKEEYDKLLLECDLAVLSLNKDICGLGSPSKYYGYLAAGKPVLAILPKETDIASDIEAYKNGVHILNGDSELLAHKLKELVIRKEVLTDMGKQSQSLFLKKYTLEICSQKYIDLLEED